MFLRRQSVILEDTARFTQMFDFVTILTVTYITGWFKNGNGTKFMAP